MYKSPREKFLGLTLESSRKSYYPQLKKQLEAAREKERHLQTLIDNMPARISFVDNEERYVLVNRQYETAFGLKRHQIIGRHIRSVLRADNYTKVKPYIDDALRGNQVHYETTFAGIDGELQWLDITYVPVIAVEGEVNGFYVFTLDVTQKRHAEESLRDKDLLLREIGSIAKIGGWEFDPATGRGTWTDEVGRIHDLEPDDSTNIEKGLSFYHGESRLKIEKAVKAAIEKGRAYDLELELISAKGVRKWVRTIGQPVIKNGQVVQVKGSLQDITDRTLSEQARLASEERFRLLVESAPDAILVQTSNVFSYVNSAAIRLFGAKTADDLIGTPVIERFLPDYRGIIKKRIQLLNKEKISLPGKHEVCLRLDGTRVDVEASAIPMNYQGSDGALVFMRDISERIKAEKEQQELQDQLHQAQKMESVGRLAGGVAHDYNNFLGVIIGYTELCLSELEPGQELHDNLKEVLDAANRSKAVTRQLLAFARKEAIAPEVLDLNTTVENILKMIRRLIGENIDLIWQPKASLWPIEMDPSQIDQILANLCVNARDAIENVGKIAIVTDNVTADEAFCSHHTDIVPGEFVALMVSDNGCGMDKKTSNMVFEPFFSTKATGKGTGLGLSTVYGIVRQNNGAIKVYSEPGTGTTFKIYLPKYQGDIATAQADDVEEIPKGRGETILVVEDEISILTLAQRILVKSGYSVFTAASPIEAMRLAADHSDGIELVITDVIMPEMNGRELVDQLKTVYPDLKFLFMSGYTADIISGSGVLHAGIRFIQKPFTSKDLAVKVRKVLDLV